MTSKVNADGTVVEEPSATIVKTDEAPPQDNKPVKPEHVPDKFWNAETGAVNYEAWAKSTQELEQKFHQQQQQQAKPTEKPAESTAEKPGTGVQVTQPNAIEAAMQKATTDIQSKGELSPETYAAFEAAGVPRHVVDTHAEGVIAVQNAIRAEVHSVVGDDAGFQALNEWATANLTDAEQQEVNKKLADRKTMKSALADLHSKYEAAMGKDGKKTADSNPAAPGSIQPYKSKEEMMAAVRSAEYQTSADFRKHHARRMIASEKAGINVLM